MTTYLSPGTANGAKTALITGCTGMDGSHLAEYLLSLGYSVHGLVRRRATPSSQDNLAAIREKVSLHQGDITDFDAVMRVVESVRPHEIYNCAGQSHIGTSWECPVETLRINTLGPQNLLEAVRRLQQEQPCRLYLAGSVEFLDQSDPPLGEDTRTTATSPYAAAKLCSYHMAQMYRERYGLHVSTAILGNHTSERRPEAFVTRKITASIARILRGKQDRLTLGAIDVPLDIGYAPDYVRAFYLMLQQEVGNDYIVATGEMHTLKEFIREALCTAVLGWQRRENKDLSEYFVQDLALLRPGAVRPGRLDTARINGIGWEPETSYGAMVERLMRAELTAG